MILGSGSARRHVLLIRTTRGQKPHTPFYKGTSVSHAYPVIGRAGAVEGQWLCAVRSLQTEKESEIASPHWSAHLENIKGHFQVGWTVGGMPQRPVGEVAKREGNAGSPWLIHLELELSLPKYSSCSCPSRSGYKYPYSCCEAGQGRVRTSPLPPAGATPERSRQTQGARCFPSLKALQLWKLP